MGGFIIVSCCQAMELSGVDGRPGGEEWNGRAVTVRPGLVEPSGETDDQAGVGRASRRRAASMMATTSPTARSRSSLTTTQRPSSSAGTASSAALASRGLHQLVGVAPAAEAPLLLGRDGGIDEDQQGVGVALGDLAGPLDLDLEHHVGPLGGPRARACRSGCRGTRPTRGSPPAVDARCERLAGDEDVGVGGLARPAGRGSSTTG